MSFSRRSFMVIRNWRILKRKSVGIKRRKRFGSKLRFKRNKIKC